ncbi:MAG: hypothetical protein Q9O62_09105 [Ardenticatenia bacterium]|nr:hypothetical protein [Ardenticatenia bacterium]
MNGQHNGADVRTFLARAARWLFGQPDLQWMVLPPYDIPGIAVIGCVVVENVGRGVARNVKIELQFPPESAHIMHHVQVVSEDPYILRGGGERHSFMTLRLREMQPGNTVVVYFSSHEVVIPHVKVSHFPKVPVQRMR